MAAGPGRPAHLTPVDAERVHILEAAVVTWTRQIKKVLQADPDAPLKVTERGVAACVPLGPKAPRVPACLEHS